MMGLTSRSNDSYVIRGSTPSVCMCFQMFDLVSSLLYGSDCNDSCWNQTWENLGHITMMVEMVQALTTMETW